MIISRLTKVLQSPWTEIWWASEISEPQAPKEAQVFSLKSRFITIGSMSNFELKYKNNMVSKKTSV